ncbi:retention module-containing protein, partial [Acidovorax sp. Be4]
MANATVLVTQLIGQAWIRAADGSLTVIHQGMRIPVDAEIVTASGSSMQLQADGMPPLTVGENQATVLTADLFMPPTPSEAAVAVPPDATTAALIAAINAGQDPFAQLDPTAAVLTGGGDAGGSFVRLTSVLESTSPLGLAYGQSGNQNIENDQYGGTVPVGAPAPAPAPSDPTLVPGLSTITLTSDARVIEGTSITVTATVSRAVTGSDLVVRLTDGSLITIPVGATSGTVQVDSRPDDVYQQGDTTVQVGIGGTTGGNYEQLNTSSTTNTVVADDADAVRITLTGPESVVEGGSITVTAHVEQPPQGSDLVITLTNGQVITIAAGATTGTVSYVPLPDDNVTQGDRPVQVGIAGSTGGNYENPVLGGAIDFTVKDNDSPQLLVGDAGIVNEGNSAVFNVALTKAVDADTTLSFTLGGDAGNGAAPLLAGRFAALAANDQIEPNDIGVPTVTVNGQPVVVTEVNGVYSFTVPAGTTTGIVVTVPTIADGVFEGSESMVLTGTLTGAMANGQPLPTGITSIGHATIVDAAGDVPALQVSDAGTVNEGSNAVFNVTLTHAVDADTTLSITFSGQAEAGDIGTPVVTIGGTVVALTALAGGGYSFTVPAGT